MNDTISLFLDVSPLCEELLVEINQAVQSNNHKIKDISPFNQPWFKEIRSENGKRSDLINTWNGSKEQKEFLKIKFKDRKITWGDKITKAKSHGTYKITMDSEVFYTPSINKFAVEHGLNSYSLRGSLRKKNHVLSKGRLVSVLLEE